MDPVSCNLRNPFPSPIGATLPLLLPRPRIEFDYVDAAAMGILLVHNIPFDYILIKNMFAQKMLYLIMGR